MEDLLKAKGAPLPSSSVKQQIQIKSKQRAKKTAIDVKIKKVSESSGKKATEFRVAPSRALM